MAYEKPLPRVTREDRPFWEAAKRHELVLPRCMECGHIWFPPYANCQRCLSPRREFVRASGRGTVWGVIEMVQPYLPAFQQDLPYNVVLVELDEGPKMFSNIVSLPTDQITVGMPVEVVFEDVTDEFALPKFRPAAT
jgi:uncharacterized OB-fold protein